MKQSTAVLLVALVGWSGQLYGYTAQTDSLEVIMKTFSFQYRQAVEANSTEQRLVHVRHMQQGIAAAQQAPMRDDLAEQFIEGFQRVAAKLDGIEQALLSGELAQAEQKLQQIDRLRVEYHRLRKRSFWQWLFGDRS
ncbi:cytochrome b562 [Alkalimonas sp. MEB108]|uniref:Cytochrome b562 n=1 Tax=Alkalimonas cellulosilytica TaxID=3058395 RepID=A0ABU7J2C1_9GAMM|nr:cytochrome b562 [Alkalimonas sp. MEB108]MEE2000155.1 cytochrome b562 [Alkalimonas sp. MEB108]